MSKYINKKQLFFMIFIIIAFVIGKNLREKRASSKSGYYIKNNIFRILDNQFSTQADCQLLCLDISDSLIDIIIKNGTVIQLDEKKKSFGVEGRTFNNIPLKVYGHSDAKMNRIDSVQIDGIHSCDCL
jgi:hypothetical protein